MGICSDIANPREWARSKDGKRLYVCDGPDCIVARVPWSSGWTWFGSYRDAEDDPESILTFCSEKCRADHETATRKITVPCHAR